MIPIVTEEVAQQVFVKIFEDMPSWRQQMIHYLKEENPEINTAIIESASRTNLDPKAIALGAYMAYALIEMATEENDKLMNFVE